MTAPVRLVVMGVSAVGKSTVAALLAARIGVEWVDADALHPSANIAKMAAGIALVDDDRWDWLDRVGAALTDVRAASGVVVACSALRRAYRDRIRAVAPDAFFIHLTAEPEVLLARARSRRGHFMPPSLLASQWAILEGLDVDEAGFTVDVAPPVGDVVDSILDRVRTRDT
jgi:gluconokinase